MVSIVRVFARLGSLLLILAVTACGLETQPPEVARRDQDVERFRERYGTVLGPDGLSLSLGEPSGNAGGGGGGGIGVNAFLWRASLDTIDFIPLTSADPFGGVIITDWYQPPDAAEERFKLNVYILDTQLRADALRVAVFRQTRNGSGDWQDAAVVADTAVQLENAILNRARELRIASG